MERSICRATAHFYKYLLGSIPTMLGDRKLLIAILRDFFASTNIYKKMTDPRGRVTLMDKKKRANSIAVIHEIKMISWSFRKKKYAAVHRCEKRSPERSA